MLFGEPMICAAWNNGSYHVSGAGYGLKVSAADRDAYFDPAWSTIILALPTARGYREIDINIDKASFWNECRELISKDIGIWLIERRLAPWPKSKPPKLRIVAAGVKRFRVEQILAI